MEIHMCTAEAPVNIAVIKYWGKRNDELILPVNDSISLTLSKNELCAKTTVACSREFVANHMWLNGIEENFDNPRLINCIRELKKLAQFKEYANWNLHICSRNNFPTAAGLASSAAGFACLVKAIAELYGVKEDLSQIARQGSGSACRSIYGGFVHWHAGVKQDGSDSVAMQIAPNSHWPEMRVLILVESNQFHAICLDTYPPIHYLNATSYRIIEFVHQFNDYYKENKVAYTFDAGPNACLYLLDKDVPEVLSLLKCIFPCSASNQQFIRGLKLQSSELNGTPAMSSVDLSPLPDALQYIIHTQIGNGPEIVQETSSHLLNSEGIPC